MFSLTNYFINKSVSGFSIVLVSFISTTIHITQPRLVGINILLTAKVISGLSVLLLEDSGEPGGNHQPMNSH